MKKWMAIAAPGIVALFLAAPGANAAPMCLAASTLNPTGVLLSAQQTAATICDVGAFEFNFNQLPGVFGAATPGINSAAVAAATKLLIEDLGPLSVRVTWTAADATTSWSASGAFAVFNYIYTITPLTPIGLITMDLDVYNATAPTGNVGVIKQAKEVTSGLTPVTGVNTNTAGYQHLSSTTSFSGLQGAVEITDGVLLGAAGNNIGGVGNPGSIANTLTFATPEPFTMFLSGAGLLGIGLLRRRKKA